MTRWLGSIIFLWHHKITRVVFKGLILYLAFCLGAGGNAKELSISSDSTYVISSFHYTFIHFSETPTICQSLLIKKAMLVIFIWKLIYELVIPEPKHKFFPNSSQLSPQPADLEVQSFEQIHPFFFCIAVFL